MNCWDSLLAASCAAVFTADLITLWTSMSHRNSQLWMLQPCTFIVGIFTSTFGFTVTNVWPEGPALKPNVKVATVSTVDVTPTVPLQIVLG